MKSAIFLTVVVCIVLLSACGNKGPLVLPPPKPVPAHISAAHVDPPLPSAGNVSESVKAETDNEDNDE